ncbi:MAG TPA: hypothetical protein VN781_09575 [Acidimicrobiales bacterium]|nr:hypothetical protein [Acidimicrobiales bacterium]
MEALLRRLVTAGARRLFRSAGRRALSGEYWAWIVVAGAGLLLRNLRAKSEPVISSRRLRPGDSYVVTLRDRAQPADQPAS